MRKRIVAPEQHTKSPPEEDWLKLEVLVEEVAVTSEDPDHPVEAALIPGRGSGWRASGTGEQTVRLVFAQPQSLRHIRVEFVENVRARTQQHVLRWSPDGGRSFQEVVRQQWNFSPDESTLEAEDYRVHLSGVTVLELSIIPDISGGDALASMAVLRLA